MNKTNVIVNFKTQSTKKKHLAVNNDPAIVFGIMLGGFLHRVKLCKGRHAFLFSCTLSDFFWGLSGTENASFIN